MKTFFVAALTNLRISGSLGRGLVLGPGYFLCNDPEHIKSLISADFPGLAGDLATRHLLAAPAVLYFTGDLKFSDPQEDSAEKYVTLLLRTAHQFLMSLWLVKDNAVMCDEGYLEYPYKSHARRVYGCRHSLEEKRGRESFLDAKAAHGIEAVSCRDVLAMPAVD